MKSFSPTVKNLPLVRWFLLLPSAQQILALPAHRLAQSHPDDLVDLCSPGERPSMSSYSLSIQIALSSCAVSLSKSNI